MVSSQGRGVIDCATGEKIARDYDIYDEDYAHLEAEGIGPLAHQVIPITGMYGGGLPNGTRDMWESVVVTLNWPEQLLLLIHPGSCLYGSRSNHPDHFTKIGYELELRAYGFSPTGKSLIIATSSDVTIYHRGSNKSAQRKTIIPKGTKTMKHNRQQRATIAQQTLRILETGQYTNRQGVTVSLSPVLTSAKEHTRLYTPEQYLEIFAHRDDMLRDREYQTSVEVTNETTLHAARRLIVEEHEERVLCLNFASAKNPGGGFLGGSQAQEESLARASGLYPCLTQMTGYYESNRNFRSCLYTDHIIYSPDVPVFRDDDNALLDTPYTVSIITAPAVNRGAVEHNEPQRVKDIERVMFDRMEKVLSLCVIHEHPVLILGAWGCGVFRNDPVEIATLFKRHLLHDGRFRQAFKRVVFAVFDRTKTTTVLNAFQTAFE